MSSPFHHDTAFFKTFKYCRSGVRGSFYNICTVLKVRCSNMEKIAVELMLGGSVHKIPMTRHCWQLCCKKQNKRLISGYLKAGWTYGEPSRGNWSSPKQTVDIIVPVLQTNLVRLSLFAKVVVIVSAILSISSVRKFNFKFDGTVSHLLPPTPQPTLWKVLGTKVHNNGSTFEVHSSNLRKI